MSELYDRLKTIADVQALIDGGVRESEVLEYKTASKPFGEGEKTEIAKDVSAMANSLGGTIIYGVATNRNDKTLPEMIDPNPIDVKNIETLDRFINDRIRPVIRGLQKKFIPDRSPHVMVLDIPESQDPPHQNLYDKRYYRRSNSESLPMEHDLVALKFGRKLAPVLEMKWQPLSIPLQFAGAPPYLEEAVLRVFVVNQGQRAARHIQLVMIFPPPDLVRVADRKGHTQVISQLHAPRQALQFQNDQSVYHAHTSASVVEAGISLSTEFLRGHRNDWLFEWILYADEMEPKVGVVTLADLGWDKIEIPAAPSGA
jgi:schlafen family protein